MRLLPLIVFVAGCTPRGEFPVARRAGDAPIYELRNGRWYDDTRFVEGTRYSVSGVLTTRRPANVDSVIDLAGRWVVPAFGEAHNHNAIPSDTIARRLYRNAGIYYVRNPNNFPRDRAAADTGFGRPGTLDVVFSNGGFTGPEGHPIDLVRRNIARGVMRPEDGDGNFYHLVRTAADVDRVWPAFLATRPQFVKTYLLYSEEYDRRLADPATSGWRGLHPAVHAHIARAARASGLRVVTHVETAADFRAAINGGADEIAHLPGFRPEGRTLAAWYPLDRFHLTEDDARLAASRQVEVATTVSEALELLAQASRTSGPVADSASAVRDLIVRNLRLLRDARVAILAGSDRYRETSQAEIFGLRSTGLFDNASLLRMWSVTTPRALFPGRRIGSLATTSEASFLVLGGDPLADFENVRKIELRMQRGWLVR